MDERTEQLIRENERMKMALRALLAMAVNATFGGWRFNVAELCRQGLGLKT